MSTDTKPFKPLGKAAYGSIPHIIGSQRGPGDHGVNEGQTRIVTERIRDHCDTVWVQEKLDGSCVAAWRNGDEIVPLIRAGYNARTSKYEQHHLWADWVDKYKARFLDALLPGERMVGEWLAQAHGTRYSINEWTAFVPFDIFSGDVRLDDRSFVRRVRSSLVNAFQVPVATIGPIQPEDAMRLFTMVRGFTPEGVVYRVERDGKPDFICKYVRPGHVPGKYLPEVSGEPAVWNWRPE